MTAAITDEKGSPPSPQEWTRPTLGNTTDMGSLFDQIRKGLDQYNKNQRPNNGPTKNNSVNDNGVRGRNRFSSQFTGLRKAAVAKTKAESQAACLALLSGGTITAAAATASSPASSSASKDPDADKPILFGSQLRKNRPSMFDTGDGVCKPPLMSAGSLSAYNAPYRLPKLLPAPAPLKFDPPRFTFGAKNDSSASGASSSMAASRPLKKSVTPDWLGEDKESSSSSSSADKASSSQPQDQASRDNRAQFSFASLFKTQTSSTSTKSHTGKRKNLDLDTSIISNSTSSYSSNHTTVTPSGALESRGSASIYFNPNDYGNMMNSSSNVYPVSSYGGGFGGNRKYTQEEVDGLIAFADKWIPTPKKRRVGDKEDDSIEGICI